MARLDRVRRPGRGDWARSDDEDGRASWRKNRARQLRRGAVGENECEQAAISAAEVEDAIRGPDGMNSSSVRSPSVR